MNKSEPRSYKNPPIQEALVEVRFRDGGEFDFTIPGKLHQHADIAGMYAGKPQTQRVSVQVSPASSTPGVVAQVPAIRIQLVDESGARMLSMGQDALTFHSLRPYEGWATFRRRIEAGLRAFYDVAGKKEVIRVGVRYINRIEIPNVELELTDFFLANPQPPSGLPKAVANFFGRMELHFDDGCKAVLTQASLHDAPEGRSAFLVDLDLIWDDASTNPATAPLSFDDTLKFIDDLHEREKVAFESLITEKTRGLFNEL